MELSRRSQIALGLAGAVALGLALGSSAVSAIDPVFFRGAAPPPRAFTATAQPQQPETPFAGGPFQRSDPAMLRAALCARCAPQPAGSGPPSSVPYFGSREERATMEARERRAIDDAYATAARERATASRRTFTGMGGPASDEEDDRDAEARDEPAPEDENRG